MKSREPWRGEGVVLAVGTARGTAWTVIATLLLLANANDVVAQWTGHELALDGPAEVRAGRSATYRGVAYRVRGLAELVPSELRVRARFASREAPTGPWVEVRSDAHGRFEIEIPIAEREPEGTTSTPRIQVEVGPASAARLFESPLVVESAVELVLRTDRLLYESGEPVHVWAWLRERTSGRPISGQTIELIVEGGPLTPVTRSVQTGASGVAHLELAVPESAPESSQVVVARVPGQLRRHARFEVGTRTYERLIARVEVEPSPVAPSAPATVVVSVSTVSGAPVVGARVALRIDNVSAAGSTGANGVARIETHAPAYLVHDTGSVAVSAEIIHPAHGSVHAVGTMRLAVPLALAIEVVARHGVLVPEIDDVVYVRLRDGVGNPPTGPTEVTVEGPAIPRGRATLTTDANGIAEVPVRLPIGASSGHRGRTETSLLVTVAGPLARIARVQLQVDRSAEVAPTPSHPVIDPGGRVEVQIARRPSVARRDVVLELLDANQEILVVRWLAPNQRSVALDVPADRLGVLTLRARAIHSDETLEGVGARARIIVRPSQPDFVTVDSARERWTVGETARVTLHTGAGGPTRYAAVLVRDLAAHGGEMAFAHHFLRRQFDRALLTPSNPAAERLVFAALGAAVGADTAPPEAPPLVDALGLPSSSTLRGSRGLRDPFPIARELERRGIRAAMRALEERVARALEAGGIDAITTTAGGSRRLSPDLLTDDVAMVTLGAQPLTPAILEAADPSFRYDAIASRVARARLVRLMVQLAAYLDPGDHASPAARMAAREPFQRWLPRMVELGLVTTQDLDDPWGHQFVLRRTRQPAIVISAHGADIELVSPGPDGRLGTRDDMRDPFARVVDQGTPYALASGEDELMRRLAVLSPVERTLYAIRESYRRINAEVTEERIGDAVRAEVSEGTIGLGNLGTIGHGGGGGTGSGYGRGAGGLRGRSTRVPRIRTGNATVSGLAGVIRERFPPTLLFRPSIVVDPSGTTEIDIPLADAVTTFIVEVIVWREDGWVWSANTRIRVDRDIVISAPVPALVHRGDRVSLPLRVANRGAEPREVELRLGGSRTIGVEDVAAQRVTVPAGDAVVVRVDVGPTRIGEGTIDVVVASTSGEALDAVRMPMRVVEPARRVALQRDAIAAGRAAIDYTVPAGADPRDGRITLSVGPALFSARGDDGAWGVWAPAAIPNPDGAAWLLRDASTTLQRAFAIGAAWNDEQVEDGDIDVQLTILARRLDNPQSRSSVGQEFTNSRGDEDDAEVHRLVAWAWALLAMRQVAGAPDRRSLPRAFELIERARREVGTRALAQSDPRLWVLAAAALGWTSPRGDLGRTRELVRRVSRHVVEVGDDLWLALEHRSLRGTALLAMAELAIGHRERSFAILATLGRWEANDHRLPAPARAIARATVHRLMRGEVPTSATLTIDGVARDVELEGGAGAEIVPELAEPGAHLVEVSAGTGAPLIVELGARYGVPWSTPPRERGPLELSLEGEVGGLDQVSRLVLVVRNRSPRTLRSPIVELELPTGAELTAHDRSRMGVAVSRGGGVLTLRLPPMRPGNRLEVPILLRWSVAGHLRGLGAVGRTDDRPDAVTILEPRVLVIEEVTQ